MARWVALPTPNRSTADWRITAAVMRKLVRAGIRWVIARKKARSTWCRLTAPTPLDGPPGCAVLPTLDGEIERVTQNRGVPVDTVVAASSKGELLARNEPDMRVADELAVVGHEETEFTAPRVWEAKRPSRCTRPWVLQRSDRLPHVLANHVVRAVRASARRVY